MIKIRLTSEKNTLNKKIVSFHTRLSSNLNTLDSRLEIIEAPVIKIDKPRIDAILTDLYDLLLMEWDVNKSRST